MNRASIMALLDTVLLRSWRIGADPIVASTALTADQLGHVVVDATAGAVAVTLPSAVAALRGVEVTLRRKDVTTNVLSIVAAGADKIVLPGDANGIAATELLFPGDYLTLRADGAGKWWCVAQAQLPASVTSVITKFAVAGVYTYTVPAVFRSGRRRALVTVTGGGGGGAHTESTTIAAGGGGGGGRGTSNVDLYGINTVTVTVGVGGPGAPAGASAAGTSGGASSFGAFISSTGGVNGSTPSGGIAGTTTGDIVHPVSAAGSGTANCLGNGGGYGGGSKALNWNKGDDGLAPGGGGAGGSGTSGTRGGGKGAPGEVLIEVA
ncbi:hypothetical protein [Pseudomonas putida]|uniref:Glycine-rich domain-containing protein n=1 Tax=Pseudomonas putida TaxID=303 RepID=A0A6S5TF20_PSEPU|nr:hypothetical protein [Pseudomonas putida]BBT38960.1 hypothetical protein WP8W18C01_13010 [Pseudomonas putida]